MLRRLKSVIGSPVVLTVLCSAISAGVLYLRKYDLFTNPQFHAEDGVVLFTRAVYKGCASVLEPYAGYYILYQRLIACAGLNLDLSYVPAFYIGGMFFAVVLVTASIFRKRVPFASRMVAALALVLSPVRNEVFFGPTNSQWILSLLLILILVSDAPKTPAQKFYDLLLLCLAGLSGPFCIVFSPLFALRLLWRRDAWSVLLVLACGLLCLVQTWNMDDISRVPGPGGTMFDYARVLTIYIGSIFAAPYAYVNAAETEIIWGAAGAAVGIHLAGALYGLWKKDLPVVICALAGPLIIASTFYAFQNAPLSLTGPVSRYWFVPTVTLVWMLAGLMRHLPVLSWTLILAMLLNLGVNFSFFQGPHFKDHNWEKWSACLETDEPVCIIPHPPDKWQTTICESKEVCDAAAGK